MNGPFARKQQKGNFVQPLGRHTRKHIPARSLGLPAAISRTRTAAGQQDIDPPRRGARYRTFPNRLRLRPRAGHRRLNPELLPNV